MQIILLAKRRLDSRLRGNDSIHTNARRTKIMKGGSLLSALRHCNFKGPFVFHEYLTCLLYIIHN
jgi:hypothetical protein